MKTLDEILEKISKEKLYKLNEQLEGSYNLEVLKGKTQIKNKAVEQHGDVEHDSSHLNTRYYHSSQVSTIAEKIAKVNGLDEKRQIISSIIGLCHDLGHTPFGHDGEVMFGGKMGQKFAHSKYGAKIFENVLEVVLNQRDEDGQDIFDEDTKRAILELGPYISAGIELHDSAYYSFYMDKEIEELEGKETLTAEEQKRLETLRRSQEPCVQAAMLSDSVAIMQSDTHDISISSMPYAKDKTIATEEEKLNIAKDIGFTEEDAKKMIEQIGLTGKNVDDLLAQISKNPEVLQGKASDEKLLAILQLLGDVDYTKLQNVMATAIGAKGLNENGRFESIPDAYKLLADDSKKGYIKYIEATLPEGKDRDELIGRINEDWQGYREGALQEQRKILKEKNPLLCLTYELQNTLMYGKVLSTTGNMKTLDNDVERNATIFSRTWDSIESICDKEELTEEEQKIKDELENMSSYPKMLDEDDEKITDEEKQKRIMKNKIAYFLQQRGNSGIKELYEELVQEKEEKIYDTIEKMRMSGKTEEEIIDELGIDLEKYATFSKKIEEEKKSFSDEMKARLIATRLLQGKKGPEICEELGIDKEEYARIYQKDQESEGIIDASLKEDQKSEGIIDASLKDETLISSGIEKRKLDEIISGKSILDMYVEYGMTLEEIDEVSQRLPELEKKEEIKQPPTEHESEEQDGELPESRQDELGELLVDCDKGTSMEDRQEGMQVTKDLQSEEILREEKVAGTAGQEL